MNVILKPIGARRCWPVTAALLVMVGASACVIPAWRATASIPMIALRAE